MTARCTLLNRQPAARSQASVTSRLILRAPDYGAEVGEGATPGVDDVLSSSGAGLDAATRGLFEPRFAHDFSRVRIHTDTRAAGSARAVSARAYTVGSDIAFAPGQYSPGTTAGRHLLAHELTHVVQQSGQSTAVQTSLEVSRPEDAAEVEAERVADSMLQGPPSTKQKIDGLPGAVALPEEEESTLQRTEQSPAKVTRVAGPQTLYRAATFSAGTVNAVNNAAAQIAASGPAGQTKPVLNGSPFIGAPAAISAIKAPVIANRSAAGGVESWITSVPTNTGSSVENVLNAGPWSTSLPKATAGPLMGLPACTGPGQSTLTAHGKPTDGDVAVANRTHEDHHAKDDETIFNNVLGNWDRAMAAAKSSIKIYKGADQAASETALYADVGGTPAQVATNFWDAVDAAGRAFHGTPGGTELTAFNATSSADCATTAIDVRM